MRTAQGRPQGAPLRINPDGDLLVTTGGGDLRFHKPVVYQPTVAWNYVQRSGDHRSPLQPNSKPVEGHYVLTAHHEIRFEIGAYDGTKPLVIDPALTYSTFLGASSGFVSATAVAVDSSGNAFLAGVTNSPDFPTTPGALERTARVFFVAEVNPTGSALVYSTYFGGTTNNGIGGENVPKLVLDSSDNVYLTGYTSATDFPVTAGAFQRTLGSTDSNAFVTKLNPSGSALVYSTYLGGTMGALTSDTRLPWTLQGTLTWRALPARVISLPPPPPSRQRIAETATRF